MRKILSITLIILLWSLPVSSTPQPQIIFTEIQTGSEQSATQEFIEIANISQYTADLSSFYIQYLSANGTNWQNKLQLEGELLPNGRLVVSTNEYIEGVSFEFAGGLASTGGHLRLYQIDSQIEFDLIGWGTATQSVVESADAPGAGESLKRTVDEDGYFATQSNNREDWFVSVTPTPSDSGWQVSEPEDETTTNPPTSTPPAEEPTPPPSDKVYDSLELSELMPDPISPLLDKNDEFIELYNSLDKSINLDDYYVQIGSRVVSLDGYSIASKSFLTIFSSDSSISLSNTGKTVSLHDGNNLILDTTEYPKAEPGKSWSKNDGKWEWAAPTPSSANNSLGLVDEENPEVLISESRDYSTPSETSISQRSSRSIFEEPAATEIEPIDYSILASVGVLSVFYVLYEYRQDLGNRFLQFRRYVSNSREDRPKPKRGRSNRIVERYRRRKDSLRARLSSWHQKLRSSR